MGGTTVAATAPPHAAVRLPAARPAAAPRPLEVRATGLDDPLVRPLLDGLAHEYRDLLGHPADAVRRELGATAAADFAAPSGCLLLLLDGGTAVAGGAFRRHDARTAELKRIWTAPTHRRRGLARRVLAELEARAATAGYERVHLTTGLRQSAAHELYRAAGYSGGGLLPGPAGAPLLAFGKVLRG